MASAQVSAGLREMRQHLRAAEAAAIEALRTISVPADSIARWESEIAALPARKRKNWKDNARDRQGVKCVVVWDEEGVEVPGWGRVHFLQRMNAQKKAMYDTNQAFRPVLPLGWQNDIVETDRRIIAFRTGTDAAMDGAHPDAQRAHMRAEQEQNATGNHGPRHHPVRVRTAAGEPVRG